MVHPESVNLIKLAISPCPNDTFIFDAILQKRIDLEGIRFVPAFHDVETLNRMALSGEADMIKVSFFTYLLLQRSYVLLDSGSAMGFGSGPLLISKKPFTLDDLPGLRVAIPGRLTTAHMLFSLAAPNAGSKEFMVFSEIENAILEERVDAGVIIHENRFTYESKGLRKIIDLGQYWETLTGAPVPLGGIIARKALGYEVISKLNRIMRDSVGYAMKHPELSMPFVRKHAQEMDEEVMRKHIGLYVNENTLRMGDQGKKAIALLMELAEKNGLLEK